MWTGRIISKYCTKNGSKYNQSEQQNVLKIMVRIASQQTQANKTFVSMYFDILNNFVCAGVFLCKQCLHLYTVLRRKPQEITLQHSKRVAYSGC